MYLKSTPGMVSPTHASGGMKRIFDCITFRTSSPEQVIRRSPARWRSTALAPGFSNLNLSGLCLADVELPIRTRFGVCDLTERAGGFVQRSMRGVLIVGGACQGKAPEADNKPSAGWAVWFFGAMAMCDAVLTTLS